MVLPVNIHNEEAKSSRRKIMNNWLLPDKLKKFSRPSLSIGILKARIVPRNKKKSPHTCGLTNMVLHGKRINHTIIDPREKTKHLFK